MSAWATAAVWSHSGVSGSDLLVLLAIADAANQEGENSWQSVATLGRMARVSESTVHRSLKTLRETGHIVETGVHPDYGTKIYALDARLTGGASLTPPQVEGGVTQEAEGVSPVTPKPRTNPTTTSSYPLPSESAQEEVRGKMTKSWKPSPTAIREATERFTSITSRLTDEWMTFRDWHISQDTGVKTRSQWDALWMTWCDRKNAQAFRENKGKVSDVEYDDVTGMPKNPKPMRFVKKGEQ